MHQFEHKRKDITIVWQKPISIDEVKQLQENKCKNTYFYKIVGHYNSVYKLFYIGKCYKQYITTRIFQKDHIQKQANFKKDHKKHELMVSLGNLADEDYTSMQISNVESLLIYSHTHDDFSDIKNKQCRLNHNVIENYRIINKGWREENMYQIVAYGLFVK
jgi:hypothetical protein